MTVRDADAFEPPAGTDPGPLAWLMDELERTLTAAVEAVRAYVEANERSRAGDLAPVDAGELRWQVQALHQAAGALDMVELRAEARTVAALQGVLDRLVQRPLAAEAAVVPLVEHGVWSLQDQLLRHLRGRPLPALALFPPYRDWQQWAQGRAHPADLWSAPLSDTVALPPGPLIPPGARMRLHLERLALPLLREGRSSAAAALAQLAGGVARAVEPGPERRFWLIAAAVFEGLATQRLALDVWAKRALAALLRQVAQGTESPADRWDSAAHEWLYLAARIDPAPDEALPHAKALWQAQGWTAPLRWDPEQRALGLCDPRALAAARAALTDWQHAWEAAEARGATPPPAALAPLADALAALPDPLPAVGDAWREWAAQPGSAGVPGADAVMVALALQAELEAFDPGDAAQRERLTALAARLQALARGDTPPEPEAWLTQHYRAWSERAGARQLAAEWRGELAALEAAFDAVWRRADTAAWQGLQDVPARLHRLAGSAALMGLPAAEQALAAVASVVDGWLRQGQLPDADARALAAEPIGANLAALGAVLDVWVQQPADAAEAFQFDPARGVLQPLRAAATSVRAEPPAEREPAAVTTESAEPAAADDDAAFDERAVFLEEARDLLAALPDPCSGLRDAPADSTLLARVRRAFHTLKGSARLVGLTAFGEAAWQVERRLNAWLAEARPLSVPELDALQALHGLLSPWVEALAAGSVVDEPDRLAAVEARLHALDEAVTSTAEPEPDAEAEVAPAPAANEPVTIGPLALDAELYQVFLQEADAHSLALDAALADWAEGAAVDLMPAADHAHALAGQSATIGHAPLAALARALEDALLRAVAVRGTVPLAERALPARAAGELRGLLHQLAAGCYREPAPETLSALAAWPSMPAVPSIEPVTVSLDDFRAEAETLLPRLSATASAWAQDAAADAKAELLRLLHTAKGGARLAGLTALADAAHALEAELLAAPAGTASPALRQALDFWLADAEQVLWPERAPAVVETPPLVEVPPFDPAEPLVASPPLPAPAPASPETTLRVRADLIDRLLAGTGDQLVTRQRLTLELEALRRSLRDMAANVERLRQQSRELQRQTESQAPAAAAGHVPEGFDALELDRYTRVQELTRLLAESIDDVATVQHQMQRAVAAAEGHVAAQERQAREGQRELLDARLVPFDSVAERLARGVRQAADARGRVVDWQLSGAAATLDRSVLERLVPVLEHLVRNAVVHGIEPPEVRSAAGKPAAGRIALALQAQGHDLALTLTDDGAGLDLERLRARAVALGLHAGDAPFTHEDALRCAFTPGVSTAEQADEWAGRGIGLDAVRREVLALGGRIDGFEPAGGGTGWRLVVPLTTAITSVVLVQVDGQVLGLPVPWVEAVRRVHGPELTAAELAGQWREGGALMPLHWLGALLGSSPRPAPVPARQAVSVVECHSAGHRVALRVDAVLGRQTVVLRPLPPLLARQPGLVGASAQPDGSVVLIYQPLALLAAYGDGARRWAADASRPAQPMTPPGTLAAGAEPLVLVVDDSITVRRVTQRLLRRAGYRVALAGDGVQALERLREATPVVVLCDIEMPRMDGFELVRALRNDPRWTDLPVVMVTSRLADKHRAHAEALGVNHYLGKPYAEDELLALVAAYARLAPSSGGDVSPS